MKNLIVPMHRVCVPAGNADVTEESVGMTIRCMRTPIGNALVPIENLQITDKNKHVAEDFDVIYEQK